MKQRWLRRAVLVLAVTSVSLAAAFSRAPSSRAQVPPFPTQWPTALPPLPFPTAAPTSTPTATATATATAPTTTSTTTASTTVVAAGPHAYGLVPATPAELAAINIAPASLMESLPFSVDMSAEFPSPGDQGQQSSCVSWALAYGWKSFSENRKRAWGLSGNDHVFSPAFLYNQHHQGGCNTGMAIPSALAALATEGVSSLKDFPYSFADCTSQPSDAVRAQAKSFRIQSYKQVANDVTEIRGHLAAKDPVVIAMRLDKAFDSLKGSAVFNGPPGPTTGRHAMVVVGYDDGRQAFRILNSWGKNWGDGGYAWIGYSVFSKVVDELYVARDFANVGPSPLPTPTPKPNPTPTPTPAGVPEATVSPPTVMHNILVENESYMAVSFAGTLKNASGRKYQIVLRFTKDGAPIPYNNVKYRDVKGNVASGGPRVAVATNTLDLNTASALAIPYPAMWPGNKKPTAPVKLKLFYDVYVDDFHVARSAEREMFVW